MSRLLVDGRCLKQLHRTSQQSGQFKVSVFFFFRCRGIACLLRSRQTGALLCLPSPSKLALLLVGGVNTDGEWEGWFELQNTVRLTPFEHWWCLPLVSLSLAYILARGHILSTATIYWLGESLCTNCLPGLNTTNMLSCCFAFTWYWTNTPLALSHGIDIQISGARSEYKLITCRWTAHGGGATIAHSHIRIVSAWKPEAERQLRFHLNRGSWTWRTLINDKLPYHLYFCDREQ